MSTHTDALEKIKSSREPFITPALATACLGMTPYTLNVMYRECRDEIPFPVMRSGTRLKIPRKAFLTFLGEEDTQ